MEDPTSSKDNSVDNFEDARSSRRSVSVDEDISEQQEQQNEDSVDSKTGDDTENDQETQDNNAEEDKDENSEQLDQDEDNTNSSSKVVGDVDEESQLDQDENKEVTNDDEDGSEEKGDTELEDEENVDDEVTNNEAAVDDKSTEASAIVSEENTEPNNEQTKKSTDQNSSKTINEKDSSDFGAEAFEEVDSNITVNKLSTTDATDDVDALCDDRTQQILNKKKQDAVEATSTEEIDKNAQIPSPMDVDADEETAVANSENKSTSENLDEPPSKATEIEDVEMRSVESKDGRDFEDDEEGDGEVEDDGNNEEENKGKETDQIDDYEDDQNDGEDVVDKSTGDAPESSTVTDDQAEKDKEVEANVEAEEPGESADICLIPDNDEELTGAEKEQAILARQIAEKDDENTEKDEEKKDEECQPTPAEDAAADDPDTVIEIESPAKDTEEPQKIIITAVVHSEQTCMKCGLLKSCEYRYKDAEAGEYVYLCETTCIEALTGGSSEKYFIRRKKYMVEDVPEQTTENCILCKEMKMCKYNFMQDEDVLYICNDDCFNLLTKEEPEKLRLKRNSIRVKDLSSSMQPDPEPKIVARTAQEADLAKLERENSFLRQCANCSIGLNGGAENLQWQTLEFCNQLCLGKYQNTIGEKCRTCTRSVSHQNLGKYCVRFGFEICQFCCAGCLDKYKKSLKKCSYCQKDIASGNEGFLAPVGDNDQFKDFCSQVCMRSYDILCNPKRKLKTDQCSVCNNKKSIRVEIQLDNREHNFCSNPCFSAFKFVNNIVPDQCGMCAKYFERKSIENYTIYNEKCAQVFCSQICMNMFITQKRKIVFCQWCKVKKYNFDMIEKRGSNNEIITMCSLNCLVLYGVSLNALTKAKMKCDNCLMQKTPQYHLTMSDSSIRNFCTYQCVMQFQSQFSRAPLTFATTENETPVGTDNTAPFPTGLPKRVKPKQTAVQTVQVPLMNTKKVTAPQTTIPVISNITSLAGDVRRTGRRNRKKTYEEEVQPPSPPPPLITQLRQAPGRVYTAQIMQPTVALQKTKIVQKKTTGTMTTESGTKTAIVTIPPLPPKVANKNTMCKPLTHTKGITCKPLSFNIGCQTDEDMSAKILIPIPVPIYVPQPMYMYSAPFPVPVPIPLPIPVPIFIPTTRNSASGIMKEIKKIQDKMPTDPFEAELLMMAEMVAGDKKKEESDSDDEDDMGQEAVSYANNEVIVDANHSYGEDVLQMALKMATEYDEPAVDLESAMTANTITQPPPGTQLETEEDDTPLIYHQMQMHDTPRPGRGRKRLATNVASPGRNNRMMNAPNKRQRRNDVSVIHQPDPVMSIAPSPTPPSQIITTEKPDANMCLKYTFGVNAWKQWVMSKNADLEKSSIRRKPFKSELLQMTADELNYSLCLFVKEVRKPNGTEYAPDTIYYLVLGIQQYLYENGRIDNIFTDPYYERFTDCLDEVAKKFSILYNDSQYIVTRVEEEHLWECKQLGAHSPHVLLSTLMFFNTKHFNLTTVEEHMQLSFSHIMKHWKRNAQGAKAPGSRNVLLRFYPPQAGGDSRKKKVYEQQENEQNPLRCPVRLYEFYLSKCPESVKTRNDVFYLQPERSCVPDSPVWYSTQALSQENLQKMLHRVKMVKEINVALLTI